MLDTLFSAVVAFFIGVAFLGAVMLTLLVPGFILSVLIPGANLIDGMMVFLMGIMIMAVVTLIGTFVVLVIEDGGWQ